MNRNLLVLDRLQQVYSAVLALSDKGFSIEAIDLNQSHPKLTITTGATGRPGEFIGAGLCCGCEVQWVGRGR